LKQDAGAALGTNSIGGECTLSWTPKAYTERSIDGNIEVKFSAGKGIAAAPEAEGASSNFRITINPRSFQESDLPHACFISPPC
jgi:hypothetical protein